ncbi:DJ-1/PfpI family protein [Streptomyces sp. NPDC086549]|uniref:DJ-1/PfpI family protein n=1 Tax=Streptomyces sp. NPDC086549 TaxID=3365752 RepID=UPI0037F9E84B
MCPVCRRAGPGPDQAASIRPAGPAPGTEPREVRPRTTEGCWPVGGACSSIPVAAAPAPWCGTTGTSRLRDLHQRGTVLASVCTGSLVLATAGLLAGRPATHRDYLDKLAKTDGTVDVRARDRYVDDGDVVTSAGVSAGIDMALHLVARFGGVQASEATRAGIQYEAPESDVEQGGWLWISGHRSARSTRPPQRHRHWSRPHPCPPRGREAEPRR